MPPPLDGWIMDPPPEQPTQTTGTGGWKMDPPPAPAQQPPQAAPAAVGGWVMDPPPAVPQPPQAAVTTPAPVTPQDTLGDIFAMQPSTETAPPDNRQGATESALAALGDVGRESRQLATGDAFSATEAPPQVERTPAGRIMYGLTHSSPTLGAMLLGAAGGTAAGTSVGGPVGGVVGGLAGGALGGGLTDFAQSLIPAYQDALRQGLDHEAAVNQAWHMAEASGAFTGLTAPLFGLRAVKSAVGNLLFHAAVTGPATGAVKQGVIDPAITGQPTPGVDEMIQGAIENAIGGGVTGGVLHYGHSLGSQVAARLRGATTSGDTAPPGSPGTQQTTPPPIPGQPSIPIPPRPTPFTDLTRPPPEGVAPGEAVPTPEPSQPQPGTPPNATEPTPAEPPVPGPGAAPVVPEPPTVTGTGPGVEPTARPTGPVPVDGGPPIEVPAPGAVRPEPAPVTQEPPATTPGVEPGATPVPGQGEAVPGTSPEPPAIRPETTRRTEGEQSPTPPGEPGASPGRTEGEQTPTPPPPESNSLHQHLTGILDRLDQEKAPDEAYREAFSTRTKDDLAPGQTWRGELVKWIEQVRPEEEPAPAAVPGQADEPGPAATPAPEPPEPPAKRPVTKDELGALDEDLTKARTALAKAERTPGTPPERLATLRQRADEALAARNAAEGPPTKPAYIKAPPGAEQAHQEAVKAHDAAVAARIHAEGEAPVPAPGEVGKLFRMGAPGGQGVQVLRVTDPAGNAWVGNGTAMAREDVLGRAAAQAEKLKTSRTDTLGPGAFERAMQPKAGVKFTPVTWERRVTAEGKDLVVGTLPDGTHVTVQKPVYDTLHAAAGLDGKVTAATGKTSDNRLFAHNAKGELTGVGMPYQLDQARARVYARGKADEAPAAPAPALQDAGTEAPRSLTIERIASYKSADATLDKHTFGINGRDGQELGTLDTTWNPLTKNLEVVDVNVEGGANALGARGVMELRRALLREYPEAETMSGRRISGANPDRVIEQKLQQQAADRLSDAGTEDLQSRQGARRKAPAPGEPPPLPPRTKAPPRKDPVVTPHVGDPPTFEDYAYSPGTPRYRDAFHDALSGTGVNPDTMVNRPIEEQVQVLSKALADKYAFDKVEIDPGVDPKVTRDQLLNMHHNMQNMAHALGWSEETIALNGRLGLHLVPYNFKGESWYGAYSFADRTIHISGGSNSYAHEHWHAIDDYLSDLLNKNPNKKQLLSWDARDGQLDPSDPVQSAFAQVINRVFYNQGAEAVRRLALERTANKTDKAGNPTKQALAARREIEALDKGASKLRIAPSDLRAAALRGPSPQYWASAHELFARVGEAYTAHKMEVLGLDPSGVVKPSKGYQDRMLAEVMHRYPHWADRMDMFRAFDQLVEELGHASTLNRGLPPAERTSEAHTLAPWSQRPPDIRPGVMTALREDMKALTWANLFGKNAGHDRLFSDPDAPKPPVVFTGKNTAPRAPGAFSGTIEKAQRTWYSPLGNLEEIIHKIPPKAREFIERIRDRIGTDPESGRLIGRTYEERVRRYERPAVSQFEDIFRDNKIVHPITRVPRLTAEQDAMVRHVLTTGETSYPLNPRDVNRTGPGTPIPPELVKLATEIRTKILDPSYDRMKQAGMDLGYARNGYFPRTYKDREILNNKADFIQDKTTLNRLVFDKDMAAQPDADKPARLHKWWAETPDAVRRSGLFPDETVTAMRQLGRNLRRIREIDAELKAGPGGPGVNPTAHDPVRLNAERDQLLTDNDVIYIQHKTNVRDPLAHHEANNVFNRIAEGDPLRFATLGPDSQFLKGRTLPPEADTIMRNWMNTKVLETIPTYLRGTAAKTSYHELFGKHGQANQDDIRDAIQIGGMHGAYGDQIRSIIEAVTGRSMRTADEGISHLAALASGLGAVMTLPGASLSAMAEPWGSILSAPTVRTGTRVMAGTYSRMIGAMFRTGDAAERMATARFLGIVQSKMQGAAAATRFSDYAGTPQVQRFTNKFFEMALSPAIRWIRASQTGTFPDYAKTLLRMATEPAIGDKARDRQQDARIAMRDLYVADHQMPDMLKFLEQFPGLPSRDAIENHPMGPLFDLAINRFVDRFNQDPTAAQKPMGGLRSPLVNMIQQLTAYPWAFWRNVMEPAMTRVSRSYQREWDRRTAAGEDGAGRLFHAAAATHQSLIATAIGATVLMAGTGLMWVPRQYMFNHALWQKHEDAGDLWDWLRDGTLSASGLMGPLDMLNQAATSIRYTADLSNLTEGPYLASETRYAIDVLRGIGHVISSGATGSNVETYNAIMGLEQLVVKPGMLAALTYLTNRLPAGGPLAGLLSMLSVTATSQTAMRGLADFAAGPKGTTVKPPKDDDEEGDKEDKPEPEPLTDLEEADAARAKKTLTGSGGGATQLLVGLGDDVLVPLLKIVPGPVKAIIASVLAAGGVGGLVYQGQQYKAHGEAPEKAH